MADIVPISPQRVDRYARMDRVDAADGTSVEPGAQAPSGVIARDFEAIEAQEPISEPKKKKALEVRRPVTRLGQI